jgi:thymidylate synthase (FAD)
MGERIPVLDHGFVRLVDHMGDDLSVVRAARVSYDAAWRAGTDTGSDHRLIHRLWRDRHTTPFEAVVFQLEVMTPIFVLRQWHRHRTWAYNELSARYRELPEVFYEPTPAAIGVQSSTNKQGRDTSDQGLVERRTVELASYRETCRGAFAIYKNLLAGGWPRELARAVLPVSTYSHMFAKVDLRNLFHFLDLRCDPHAQHEIRVYAEAIVELIRPIVPVCVAAWEAGRGKAVTPLYEELDKLCNELCDTVDLDAEDIGGARRTALQIVQDIGPLLGRIKSARQP